MVRNSRDKLKWNVKITQIIRRYFDSKNSKKKEKERERNKKPKPRKKPYNKIVDLHPNMSVITLNINDLHTPIKSRDCQSGFKTKKQALTICYLQKNPLEI